MLLNTKCGQQWCSWKQHVDNSDVIKYKIWTTGILLNTKFGQWWCSLMQKWCTWKQDVDNSYALEYKVRITVMLLNTKCGQQWWSCIKNVDTSDALEYKFVQRWCSWKQILATVMHLNTKCGQQWCSWIQNLDYYSEALSVFNLDISDTFHCRVSTESIQYSGNKTQAFTLRWMFKNPGSISYLLLEIEKTYDI